jgi:hypothetical protein
MGCLETADKQNCQSIALPAMGTGQLGYPKELVARHMYSYYLQVDLHLFVDLWMQHFILKLINVLKITKMLQQHVIM